MRTILSFLFLGVSAGHGFTSADSEMPAFKVERWVNSTPLTAEALRGKVVLVDFWEYTCINWHDRRRSVGLSRFWSQCAAGIWLRPPAFHLATLSFKPRAGSRT